jgi:homospermidine synthase
VDERLSPASICGRIVAVVSGHRTGLCSFATRARRKHHHVTGDEDDAAEALGVPFRIRPLTREDYRQELDPLLGPGDFLLNLSVDVSSVDLMRLCRERGALYLDTCIEPWPGGYTDTRLPLSARTNYALRESALALRSLGPGPTAVITHGANPGLVSHFVKQALLYIARDTGVETQTPSSREQWAALAARLGIRVIHIAERDTQVAGMAKAVGEFVNTWSIDGFLSRCSPPTGWGPTSAPHRMGSGIRPVAGRRSTCAGPAPQPGS